MDNLSITACSFYVRRQNTTKPKDIFNLNQNIEYVNENGNAFVTNIKDMFCDFAASNIAPTKDNNKQKTFSCEYMPAIDFENEKFKIFSFKIQSGYYGHL